MRFWELESGGDNWELETGLGDREMETASLSAVLKTFTYQYGIQGMVSKMFTYLYDIFGGVVVKTFTYLYDINDAQAEVLQEQKGIITPTILSSLNNEICFLTKSDGPRHYSLYLFVDNMLSGDEIKFKTQILDPNSNEWKSYDEESTISFNKIKGDTASFQVFLPARQIRFCLKQTKGVLRSYNWALYKAI